MSAAAILAIVVAAAEAQDPATAILLGAAAESLAPEVSVRLVNVSVPAEVDPLRIEGDLGASAVVTLVWRDAARLQAQLRLHIAATGRTTTRSLVFSAADTRAERGRTVGLAAASMWPEISAASRAGASPRRATEAAPTERPALGIPVNSDAKPRLSAEAETEAALRARREQPPESGAAPERAPASEQPVPGASDIAAARHARFRLGLAAIAATGLGGPADGLGGRLEGALFVRRSWSLRLALSLRRGSVSQLPGSDLVGALAGGVEWWPAAAQLWRTAALGIRADAMALRHQVRGSVMAGPQETKGRFLPGLDLLAQAALRVGTRIELLAAAGSEVALGTTQLRSGPDAVPVASIPALRLVAEIGLRMGF